MPRKLRTPKARRGSAIDVSPALAIWLTWRDLDAAAQVEGDGFFDIYFQSEHPPAWQAIEAEALLEWTSAYPGSRPESWWEWSAPELRRVTGLFTAKRGPSRCHPTGVPYGEPAAWHTPPMVESQPAFLDRLDLWLPGERRRVPAADFPARMYSREQTVEVRGMPDEGDDNCDD